MEDKFTLALYKMADDNKINIQINKLSNGDFMVYPTLVKEDSILAGMNILFENGEYNVFATHCGKNEDHLKDFLTTKSLKVAFKCMIRGNKQKYKIKY